MSKIVRFPAYRLYDEARVEMNDAVMAALVSVALAKHTLKGTHSEGMTSDLFPDVENIKRMHLSVESARRLLAKTDSHLAVMAIPYILSLHEDYMMTCLRLLQQSRLLNRHTLNATSPKDMHEIFESVSSCNLSGRSLEDFHLLRLIRNSFIHNGGIPSSDLLVLSTGMGADGINNWRKLTDRNPTELVESGAPMELGYGEVLLALAVTKNISQEVNTILQSTVPRAIWSDIFYEDFMANHAKMSSPKVAKRKVARYSRQFYDALSFSENELEQVINKIV